MTEWGTNPFPLCLLGLSLAVPNRIFMKISQVLLLLLIFLCSSFVFAQADFKADWKKADPVPPESIVDMMEKVGTHRQFLSKATLANDTLQQLYGWMYLFYDHINAGDYPTAARCLLEAENLSKASGNPGWQGWVLHRKGILSLRLSRYEAALEEYKTAAALCGEGHDSLCVAESLEQASAMSRQLGDFESAERYFEIAMPLIEKYGGEAQLGAALNNFGITKSTQERPLEAIPYFERSIAIYHRLGKHKEEAKGLNNLADAYRHLKLFDKAEDIAQQCVSMNQEHQIHENLITNYSLLQTIAAERGNYEVAYEYLGKYFLLKDSLIGEDTKQKIAELEVKYQSQQKELELEKSKSALETTKRSLERRTAYIFIGLLLAAAGLWRWRLQTRHIQLELSRNQENLSNMTRILMEKNRQLVELKEQVSGLSTHAGAASTPDDFEENLYKQHILTDEDWASFKVYFERAYPGYMQRLRNTYPTLSDAEERLFLIIKLNLNTKEAASMLGISAVSVKKTRNRLRKRLELGEDTGLEDFIHSF